MGGDPGGPRAGVCLTPTGRSDDLVPFALMQTGAAGARPAPSAPATWRTVAGPAMVVLGLGMWLALATPPFKWPDEQVHAGFVWVLIDGELPDIDTPIPVERDPDLRRKVEREEPGSHRRDIYTGNNPPTVYLAAVPPTWVSSALGAPSPALLALRTVSVIGTAAAVVCACGLARELASGDDAVGYIGATSTVSTVGVLAVTSGGGLDGPALAATTAVAWALARVLGDPSTRSNLLLGSAVAVAAGIRPMSAVFAGVAVVLALTAVVAGRRWRRLPAAVLAIGGPAVVACGWFYLLNTYRYGDPTGSEALFEKLGRSPGFARMVARGWPVENMHNLVANTSPSGTRMAEIVPLVAIGVGVVVAVAMVLSIARRRVAHLAHRRSLPVPAPPGVWAAMLVLGAVPFALTHMHVSGGGAAHPRYLLPAVPIAAAAAGLVAASVSRRLSVVLSTLAVLAAVVALGRSIVERRTGFLGNRLDPLVAGPAIPATIVVAATGLIASAVTAGRLWQEAPRSPVEHQASCRREVPAGFAGGAWSR